jgi:hypothetical protein
MSLKPLQELFHDISESEIISLVYNDPRIRPKMMEAIVNQSLGLKHQVQYIDFDLQFSSLLQNLSNSKFRLIVNENLQILQPGPTVTDFFPFVFQAARNEGLIIMDSLNTLQNMLSLEPTITDLKSANHRSAVLVSALQQLARSYSKTIILLSLTKSRPVKSDDVEVTWEKGIIGGRMTKFKSDTILLANEEMSENGQAARIKVSVDTIYSKAFRGKAGDEYEILLE